MSKFAIALFTVLVAAGVEADSNIGYVDELGNSVLLNINASISTIQKEIENDKKVLSKEIEFFITIKRGMLTNNTMEALAQEQQMQEAITDIGAMYEDVEIHDCLKDVQFVYRRIRMARTDTHDCIIDNIDHATTYIHQLNLTAPEEFSKLAELRQTIQQDIDIAGKETDIEKTQGSLTNISEEVSQLTDKVISELRFRMSEFELKVQNFKSTLNSCSFKSALNGSGLEWSAILRRMSLCIADKMNSSRSPVVTGLNR